MAAKFDFARIRAALPTGRTPEEKQKRAGLFKQFDPNGNGYLSLAEVDKGVRDILHLDALYDAKPVLIRAFNAAKHANDARSKKGGHGPDYIELSEFRLLLEYLGRYFELFELFEELSTDGDRRLSFDEFRRGVPVIEHWGVKVDDPRKAFDAIDTDKGGMILFDEFARWGITQHLSLVEGD